MRAILVKLINDDSNEPLSDEDVIYQITTFGADFTVDGLVKRFEREDIFRPDFQRNFVWSQAQASKFIESILLGLPIPSVFLYREEVSQKHLIVDGLQRLTTLHAFAKGRFKHNDKVFKLVQVKSRFEGKTIDDLEPEDLRRFEDAVIHAMIIQQSSPNNDNSSVYHIFDRLNSNGTPLQPQEMRAAIFHGRFQKLIGHLNQNNDWRSFFGPPHKRSKDQELILRFFALHFNRNNYERPIKNFLNEYMKNNRFIDGHNEAEHVILFENTIERVISALGTKAFRPRSALNVAVYDSMMVAIASRPRASNDAIKIAYQKLLMDEEYLKTVNDSTSDADSVSGRINRAIAFLDAAA